MAKTPTPVMVDLKQVQDVVRTTLAMPVKRGPVTHITEKDLALVDVARLNTSVLEFAVAKIGSQAVHGDVKSFEVLMKYAGLEPVKEEKLTIDAPTIINNVSLEDEEGTIGSTVHVHTVKPSDVRVSDEDATESD